MVRWNRWSLINTGDAIYWGNDVATITAYHPFSSSLKTDGTISFYRKADQSADEDYLASDLLWASTTASKTTNAVPLNFTHKLAKINVTLTSDEIEDLSGASIYICATKNSVNFNTTTGELTSLSSAEYNDVKAGTTTSTNQDESFEMTAVDLGLSVKWGSCNLGASSNSGRGDYFAWGETTPKSYFTKENYKYWDVETSSYINIGNEISGTEYDPATVMLGEGWRMPTKEECEELMNGCTRHATSTSGTTYFFVFTSKTNGNTISFGGYSTASPSYGFGDYGAYFLSSTLTYNSVNLIEVTADYHKATTWDRHWGYQIRPVYDGD